MRNRFYPVLTVVQAAVAAAIVVVASLWALDGTLTVGTAAAIVLALSGMLAPLIQLAGLLDDVLSARAALVRVTELASVPAVRAGTTALPERGRLVLEGVSFSYVPGREVLHDVDLVVEPGERVALVGATGSGKSTITRLATGLADPDRGRVTVGGVDVRDAADRGGRLLLLPQETFLVSGTVADNVALAAPGLDRARLEEAAGQLGVGLDLDAEAGAGGSRLSAGERQLVALLRIVVADPAVVALDESTSLLDPQTEAEVSEALSRALAGRAVLIVAHREATARRCDLIVRVDAGRISA